MVKIPAGLPKGEHRILLSDADTLNRMQSVAATANRFIDLPETVSLINQERAIIASMCRLCRRGRRFMTTTRRCPVCPLPC